MEDEDEWKASLPYKVLAAVAIVAQIALLVGLGLAADTFTLDAGKAIAAYFLSAAIYFAIDIAWVAGVELHLIRIINGFYNFDEFLLQRPYLIIVFFVYAAAANTIIVIVPALQTAIDTTTINYADVAWKAFALGNFAYANLALVTAWQLPNYPLELCAFLPLSGGCLSMLSSLSVVAFLAQFS